MRRFGNSDALAPTSLELTTFDLRCLELSWEWLNDPEIRRLTMTRVFTRNEQMEFFDNLQERKDYIAWGIMLNENEIVGAAGLKNYRGGLAEYWGYIGKRQYWGKGLGPHLIAAVEKKARALGFSDLDLKVGADNKRAISLYEKAGFVVDATAIPTNCLRMIKRGI